MLIAVSKSSGHSGIIKISRPFLKVRCEEENEGREEVPAERIQNSSVGQVILSL